MSNSKEALRNIAMLHLTEAQWTWAGENLRGSSVVKRPAGVLSLVYSAVADKLNCSIAIGGIGVTITLLEGEEASAFYKEKLEEVEERNASAILKQILQEEIPPHEQEDLFGLGAAPMTTFSRSYLDAYNRLKQQETEFHSQKLLNPLYSEDSFQKQIQAIRQKYLEQPSKRKK